MTKADSFPNLFASGRLGPVELENRVIRASQQTRMAHADGTISSRQVAHYRELASGGAALVMLEFAHVDDDASKAAHCQVGISREEHLPGLAWLADTVRLSGAKAGCQLSHCGRQRFINAPPLKSASRVPWQSLYEQTGLVPEPLRIDEITEIVEAFAIAAARAVRAGFDVVEIHAGHGYLFTNFLSPHTNKRTDRYGGSPENRMRILLETVEAVRATVPADVAVMIRLSGTDYEPDGIDITETVALCRRLEQLGVDAVHVSGGHHGAWVWEVSPMLIPPGPHVWAAEAIKREVEIPVVASGSITTPLLAEEVLASGKADFVSLGRPLWADPQWPLKARTGRADEIRLCIRFNDGCSVRTASRGRSPLCSVNPLLGRELEPEFPKTPPVTVAVIGGGPAGLEAAHHLFHRGHGVTLFEGRRLGGLLNEASGPPFKQDLRRYLEYLLVRLEKSDVRVEMREVTAETFAADRFDAIVVAVGAKRRALAFEEVDGRLARHALDVDAAALAGQRVVVIGGGLTGVEAALAIALAGAGAVTLCEAGEELLRDGIPDRDLYLARLREHRVTVLTSMPVEAITRAGIRGASKTIDFDEVVVAVGYESNSILASDLRTRGGATAVYEVGSCRRPGLLHDAVHGGFAVSRRVGKLSRSS